MPTVALVTHDLSTGGGTATMTAFLHRVLVESGRYQPHLLSLATSAGDNASVLLRDLATWKRGVQVERRQWRGLIYRHVGTVWAELEFQRYRRRALLDRLLAEYDIVQFVVGVPAWACAGIGVAGPVLVWTATTLWADRASRVRRAPLPRRVWMLAMSQIAETYERRALEKADFVFGLSQYTLRAIRRWVPVERSAVAVCGLDTLAFQPGTGAKGNYILSVGRFTDARKNVQLLLRAYAMLVRTVPSTPDLYLVGEPPATGNRLNTDYGLDHRVRFVGPKHGKELQELYRCAQFFVLSSDEEGLGIVVLEAMGSGLAVVSTRCGGPETLIVDGETGLLVPVGDAKALADAMQTLLEDPSLRGRMGEAARRWAQEHFSLPVTGKVFLDAYDEIFNKG